MHDTHEKLISMEAFAAMANRIKQKIVTIDHLRSFILASIEATQIISP
jgi:hypothetical protein